jgi:hypothetical protein
MREAKETDFPGYQKFPILKRSIFFYLFRIGGFLVTVLGSSAILIWGVLTNNIQTAVPTSFALVLIGLALFIVSWNASNFCQKCQHKVETFYCVESRPNGRYSGNIFVCSHCKAYETRLNLEFD